MTLHLELQTEATQKDALKEKGTARLIVKGTLDQQTLKQDYSESMSKEHRNSIQDSKTLAVDLAKVERVDTSGLAWLINIAKYSASIKVNIRFENVPEKLLNLADLSSAKEILSSSTQASSK